MANVYIKTVDGGLAASIADTDAFEIDTGTASVYALWSLFKSTLKTYFDTLYAVLSTGVTLTGTQTLTNKRIQKRPVTVTQHATPTINTDNGDIFNITGLAQAITSMTTNLSGTPVDGEMILIQITDNGTARAIAWGASFASTVEASLPVTTVLGKRLRTYLMYNSATSDWECQGTTNGV